MKYMKKRLKSSIILQTAIEDHNLPEALGLISDSEIDVPGQDGYTILHVAVENEVYDVVEKILT